MRTHVLAVSLTAAATLSLTACGGSDAPKSTDNDATATTAAPQTTVAPSIDTGDVKVDRLTESEKRYVAALVESAIANGITESLTVMESMSATEVQAEIGKRRSKCGTSEQHTPEKEIKAAVDVIDAPEKNVRAYITAKDKAIDTHICK